MLYQLSYSREPLEYNTASFACKPVDKKDLLP